jgi:repressor LexA
MKKMSVRQKQVYDFIGKYHTEHGFSPSMSDIATGLGLAHSTIATYIDLLKQKGFVSSEYGIPRSFKNLRNEEC